MIPETASHDMIFLQAARLNMDVHVDGSQRCQLPAVENSVQAACTAATHHPTTASKPHRSAARDKLSNDEEEARTLEVEPPPPPATTTIRIQYFGQADTICFGRWPYGNYRTASTICLGRWPYASCRAQTGRQGRGGTPRGGRKRQRLGSQWK